MSFEQSFQNLLVWEGGFGDDPHDAGGPTNLGVIQEEYDRYRDEKGLSRQSVKFICQNEAKEIYREKYWNVAGCDHFNEGVANCVFDAAVNSGPTRSIRWLQESVNAIHKAEALIVDGYCGVETIAAVNMLSPPELIDQALTRRLSFLHIAKNTKTGEALWPTFGRGWQKRVDGVREQSHQLCGVLAPRPPLITPPKQRTDKMSLDLTAILTLAKLVAPTAASLLERENPLFGAAVEVLAKALATTPDGLPGALTSASPDKLVAAIQAIEAQFGPHPSPAPTSQPLPTTTGDPFMDSMASIVKYAIGMIGTAMMVKMGLSVDAANGIMGNVAPVIWTVVSGGVTAAMGWLLHRSMQTSNNATTHLVSSKS